MLKGIESTVNFFHVSINDIQEFHYVKLIQEFKEFQNQEASLNLKSVLLYKYFLVSCKLFLNKFKDDKKEAAQDLIDLINKNFIDQ